MPGLKTIYTQDGKPLADVRASVTRSWLLKDIGEAVFSIAISDPKCKEEYLQYGNLILVQHETLPPWVGMIDTPRIWGRGNVEVHAYEPSLLLKYRYPPANYKFTGTPSEKFEMLIDEANAQYPTLISHQVVTVDGESTEEIYSASVYEHINGLCEKYDAEWKTYPMLTDTGVLSIGIDFIPRVGITTDAELLQGKNVLYGDIPLEENGELINSIEAMTNAPDAGDTAVTYTEPMPYGFRALRKVFSDVNADFLPTVAENYVKKSKTPLISTPLTVVDRFNLFSKIGIGNIMKYSFGSVGFNGGRLGSSRQVRVSGYRFVESSDICELFTENT